MNLLKKKNNKWVKIIKLEKSYTIKCQDKDQFFKVLKFFEEHTGYVFEDTKEPVSVNRTFSDLDYMYEPVFIVTNVDNETLYTSPIGSSTRLPTYSTAFLQQMKLKTEL